MKTALKFVIITLQFISITILPFCKKEDVQISATKIHLSENSFINAVIKENANGKIVSIGYAYPENELSVITHDKTVDEIINNKIELSESFPITDFLITNEGYIAISETRILSIISNVIDFDVKIEEPIKLLGSNLISDGNGGALFTGITSSPSLLNVTRDGILDIIVEYDHDIIGPWDEILLLKSKIYNSNIDNSRFLLFYTSSNSYPPPFQAFDLSFLINVNNSGTINWEIDTIIRHTVRLDLLPLENSGYLIFAEEAQIQALDDKMFETIILNNNGEELTRNKFEEFAPPNFIIDDGDKKVGLMGRSTGHGYSLYFFNNNGELTKKASLSNIFAENTILDFIATDDDYLFLAINNEGTWLYTTPKNQF